MHGLAMYLCFEHPKHYVLDGMLQHTCSHANAEFLDAVQKRVRRKLAQARHQVSALRVLVSSRQSMQEIPSRTCQQVWVHH
mmetsp:Transcript_18640/g.33095  ORF Transcript_18640/g.33095 Transcript_18640/m.33095 type:complete len:81 (-) Transcript_18640:5-247(-)